MCSTGGAPIAAAESKITTKSFLPERAEMRVGAALLDGGFTNARLSEAVGP